MSLLSEDREPFRLLPVEAPDDANLFAFGGSVGPNGENRREDVIKAQLLLGETGDYDFGRSDMPTGWPGSGLYRGIKAFQKRNGMEADGTLLPIPPAGVNANGVGESLYALRGELGDRFAGQAAPTPQKIDAHYEEQAKRLARGEGLPVGTNRGLTLSDKPPAQPPQAKPGEQVAQVGTPHLRLTVGGAAPSSGPAETATLPVPAHKKDIFARPENKDAWENHQQALRKLLPDNPVLRGALAHLYGEEGGRVPDPKSGAAGGILPDTLDDLRRRGRLPGLPANLQSSDLTPEQQAHVQRTYFDDVLHTVGGAVALEDLPQGMADTVADMLYLDGRGAGTELLQRAINIAAGPDTVAEDGKMGPQTWSALRRIAADRKAADDWLDAAAEERIRGKERSPGEVDRISRLRSRQSR